MADKKNIRRMHLFIKEEYQQKIMENKKPTETCTAFVERCIDTVISHNGYDKEAFQEIMKVLNKISQKTSD